MTVCIFSAQYRPRVGGVENYTHYLAEKIAEKGERAIIVTSAVKGLPRREKLESGVEVFRLPSLPVYGGRFPVAIKERETKMVLRWLAGQNIDRVIVQTRLYALSLLGARFARDHGIPALVIEHGSAYTKSGVPPVDAALKVYVDRMRDAVYNACPHFYAVSQNAADDLAKQGIIAEGLLHNSVPVGEIERDVQNPVRDFRKEYGLPAGRAIVTYTGRLLPEKGVGELAKAVRAYNRTHAMPLTLIVAGEGPLLESLRGLADPNIVTPGALPREEVMALLAQSDIFCLPTALDEGFPTSILEAGAAGVFVMATAKGGIKEMIPARRFGLLMKDGSANTIEEHLCAAMEGDAYRGKVAREFQKRVVELYSFEALYNSLKEIEAGQ